MLRIAVTGGVACGKSTVGEILESLGFPVCDADVLAHTVMAKGGPAYEGILQSFGQEIVHPDGEINRRLLGSWVFNDSAKRKLLNSIVHPHVVRLWDEWLDQRDRENNQSGTVIIPLFYEIGAIGNWDVVVCVACSESLQLLRLQERGFARDEAMQRIHAQWPVADKVRHADVVIVNSGSLDILREQTERVARCIREK